MTAKQLPDNFLMAAWWLPDNCGKRGRKKLPKKSATCFFGTLEYKAVQSCKQPKKYAIKKQLKTLQFGNFYSSR